MGLFVLVFSASKSGRKNFSACCTNTVRIPSLIGNSPVPGSTVILIVQYTKKLPEYQRWIFRQAFSCYKFLLIIVYLRFSVCFLFSYFFLTRCLGRPFTNSGCNSPMIRGLAYFSYPSFRPQPSSVIHSSGTALSTLAMAWISYALVPH